MTAVDKQHQQELEKPGLELQRIREEKGLSVDTVADQLRLDKRLIQAIENDDYDPFPATTYVRGYIRGYAKYLGVDSTALIRAFDQRAGDGPQLAPFVSRPQPQTKSNDKHMQMITYAIIAVLVVSLGLWWKNWQVDPDPVETVVQETEEPPASAEEEALTSLQDGSLNTSLEPLPSLNPAGGDYPDKQSADIEHEFGVVNFSESPEVGQTQIRTESDMAAQAVGIEVTPAPEEAPPLPDIATFEADQQKGSGIVVELKGVSWIQITDANNIRAYSGLAGPDEKINVNGEPPFRVVIGQTGAVSKVVYADRVIDLVPLTRAAVARFFVDQSGAYR